ncbi:Zinc finger MYND domain-containing protein 10 [Holothuria leucospilota]|uniref:Zinc finger MYND domain-containing protein 10 n=1 Tax=Holothuria leucospilota TaxID=206669 RepID=A0A9Q1HJV3_HOLLE|nr:Zinc finger MYND domain-containing protein 10 [Holothuria leucospilota]
MAGHDKTPHQQVLLPVEAEGFVESLEVLKVKDIGSPKWQKQHEYLEKLNMQAVVNASANEDEFIKELLISREKIPVLITDLLISEVWRDKVFSVIKKLNFEPKTTISIYMALYHEATVTNLLETVLYYKEPCEAAEDTIIDLLDFCHRKILNLIARYVSIIREKLFFKVGNSAVLTCICLFQDLIHQDKKLQFDIGVKSLSILRYLTDHLESLPLSVATRMLNTHDVPCLLVQLVEDRPWCCLRDGKLFKYEDGKWQEIQPSERLRLSRLDGQVWIALFNLLLGPQCINKYEYNDHNKNQVLKLRGFMTEVTLDQMPSLCDLQRYLEQLAMMEPPAPQSAILLEQVPEIYDKILKDNEGRWGAIAKHQVKTVFNPPEDVIREQARRFAETYNFDVIESLLSDPPKCALCGDAASKRCSRCKNEWYCGRECQVKHWSKHKAVCSIVAGET